ncbi:hypothetical protein ABE28_003070 [Peribacillus muralis]|uniref:Uncharacterized protein n=1 Tax=Peribacillus muralis TaxID=264697 RepID=A0A1B3XJC7_9BACI|nr:hypothetical protein ABE28_003070 [Peribacillus muralis]
MITEKRNISTKPAVISAKKEYIDEISSYISEKRNISTKSAIISPVEIEIKKYRFFIRYFFNMKMEIKMLFRDSKPINRRNQLNKKHCDYGCDCQANCHRQQIPAREFEGADITYCSGWDQCPWNQGASADIRHIIILRKQ